MIYQEFAPDPRLRPLVRAYWQVGHLHTGHEEQRAMPERAVRLTFSTGDAWQASPHTDRLEKMPQATLRGLTLKPLRTVSFGNVRALGADLFPWGRGNSSAGRWTCRTSICRSGIKRPRLKSSACCTSAT